ncbi:MAG: DUF2330 domain-containing protein [Archangiaceae bacterium]|nr:DUF2330 domain-containing protein [Archangiaceae bacterium]
MIRLLLPLVLVAESAHAFCGFYVSGGGAELFNNATQVALVRNGTRTVLSMQNDYQGPPEDFAMVIPVPVVLKKEQVKILKKPIFTKLDTLSAPRLVEYWEQDPCPKEVQGFGGLGLRGVGSGGGGIGYGYGSGRMGGVRVEAEFDVGEYEIVILSAEDALGLEQWLAEKNYKIPSGAAPLFRPYIQQGMKFFVAKVNVKKVAFEKGRATLSPLRFHYDSEKFELPVRLGLINSKDTQDLIVHVLARNQRYEVANLPNVTIPTNIDLVPSAKSEFGPFYASLFDKTQSKVKGSVVTEYSWDAQSCDPCPTPPLSDTELTELGLDVIDPAAEYVEPELEVKNADKLTPQQKQVLDAMLVNTKRQLKAQLDRRSRGSGFVVTRLHARYTKESLGEDLVFRAAPPIQGGREWMKDAETGLERGATSGTMNNFQARYAIRYPWTGPATCKNPQWGVWGGKPSKNGEEDFSGAGKTAGSATNTAFVKRDKPIEKLIESPIAELDLKARKTGAGLSLKAKPAPKATP